MSSSKSKAGPSYIDEHGNVILGKREKRRKTKAEADPMNQATRLVVVLEGACLETVKGTLKFCFQMQWTLFVGGAMTQCAVPSTLVPRGTGSLAKMLAN